MNKHFWNKVEILNIDDCWNWKCGCFTTGYGQYWSGATSVGAHRYAYEEYYNIKIPKGKMVCHKCDNPRCCNPNHLFLGNSSINMQDASNKGRLKQEPFYNCKQFSKEEIDTICSLFEENFSANYIGKMLKIDHKTAKKVYLNKNMYYKRAKEVSV